MCRSDFSDWNVEASIVCEANDRLQIAEDTCGDVSVLTLKGGTSHGAFYDEGKTISRRN